MAVRTRRVWRAAPGTLSLVGVFAVAAGICVPVLAYLIYLRERTWPIPIFLLLLSLAAIVYAWRFGLYPKLRATDRAVVVVNPRRRTLVPWEEITVIASGENGLLIGSEDAQAEAWCVQKSRYATRRGRYTRSDRIVNELFDLLERHDPPLEDQETGIRIRRARPDDVGLLARLERASNEAALPHIFPPKQFPFPVAMVTRRWRSVLSDRFAQVRILELFDTPIGYVCYEPTGTIRHLGVVASQTRRGFGSVLLEFACEEIFDRGVREAELWVLVENEVGRSFYRAHGWRETDDRNDSVFPPYPEQLRMKRVNPAAPRRRSPDR